MTTCACVGAGIPLAAHGHLCAACLLRLGLDSADPDAHDGAALAAERLGPIGQGPNGIVYLGRLPGDASRFVTLKIIHAPVDADTFVGLVRELMVRLGNADPVRVCRLLDAQVMSDGRPVLCAEYMPGRQIDRFLNARVPVGARLGMLAGVCDQIAGLHEAGVVHGSIKAENIIAAGGNSVASATLLDTGIQGAVEGSPAKLTGPARVTQRHGYPGRVCPDRDVLSLHHLVLEAIRNDGSEVTAALVRRLERAPCASAAALGAHLHEAALQAFFRTSSA